MKLLTCHADPYARALSTEVVACAPRGAAYAVELAESVLFPGGGGQPADHGTIGDARVLDGEEDGERIRYLVDRPVPLGPVETTVDWPRRFDHMQQHTAQHLITALAARELGWQTIAFHLNPERCDVVLSTVPDPDGIARLEAMANAAIREARPVRPRIIEPDDMQSEGVRSRLLPAGHTGPLRVIEIEGIDLNTCAGTHVQSTAELQAIRFVGLDVQKGTGRLHYLAGGRVLADAAASQRRAEALTALLNRGPAEHAEVVDALLRDQKDARRAHKALEAELATHLGAALARTDAPAAALHRDAGDLALLGAIAQAAHAARPDLLMLLTAGEPDGVFLLFGPGAAEHGPAVADALSGRGGGRGPRFQGKAARLDRRAEAAALIGA